MTTVREVVARAIRRKRQEGRNPGMDIGEDNSPLVESELEAADAALDAHNAALTAAGYAVVPAVPTEAMIAAAIRTETNSYQDATEYLSIKAAREAYRTMLTAAQEPKP